MFLLSLLFACRATISLQAPSNSDVYIVKQSRPSESRTPSLYECRGEERVSCDVRYLAWNKYYYAVYNDSWSAIGQVPNEIKFLPLTLGLLQVYPAFLYAYGPDDKPIYIQEPR